MAAWWCVWEAKWGNGLNVAEVLPHVRLVFVSGRGVLMRLKLTPVVVSWQRAVHGRCCYSVGRATLDSEDWTISLIPAMWIPAQCPKSWSSKRSFYRDSCLPSAECLLPTSYHVHIPNSNTTKRFCSIRRSCLKRIKGCPVDEWFLRWPARAWSAGPRSVSSSGYFDLSVVRKRRLLGAI